MLVSKSKKTDSLPPALPYAKCHAKTDETGDPGINVEQHLHNVTSVCQILKQQLPPILKPLGNSAVKSASVHDVGKVSPGFQLKYFRNDLVNHLPEFTDKPLGNYVTDHAHIGACALWHYLSKEDPFRCPTIAQIAAMHHGTIRAEPIPKDFGDLLGGHEWSKQREKLIQKMETQYGSLSFEVQSTVQRDCIAGMVTLSDWIGSDESFFPPKGFTTDIDTEAVAHHAVAACGLCKPTITPGLSFQDIFGFSPFEIQERLSSVVSAHETPGVYVLEAPMGMGKTEAALYAAYRLMASGRNSGFFFGLPTRLTSDGIHERINPFLQKICSDDTPPKLAHGTAWLKSFWRSSFEKGGKEFKPGNSWFNPRKRALLHPFVVGTVDQALMSVLRVKQHFVRTFGLAGKVVILDEVHSYDGYTGTLIETMASQLTEIGCSVIILSATLTAERRAAFFKSDRGKAGDNESDSISDDTPHSSPTSLDAALCCPYPLISGGTFTESAPPPMGKRYAVSIKHITNRELAEHAVEKAMTSHCVLCIANTVAKAQAWYDAISSEAPERAFPIGLLHSKFPGFQRAEIENLWMMRLGKEKYDKKSDETNTPFNRNNAKRHTSCDKRPKGCILVATQVVEQSVDIDADYLITELAPTDMLLQRMGRQWRHSRRVRPCDMPETLIVSGDPDHADSMEEILEAFGKSNCHVYAPWVLWRTLDVWKEYKTVDLPGDIRLLLEATYDSHQAGDNPLNHDFPYKPDQINGAVKNNGPEEISPASMKISLLEILHHNFEQMRDALESKAKANLSSVTTMPTGEDHEACATRYSDLPTTQTLLVKKIDSTGDQAKLTLLSGETVVVNASRPDMAVTAKLHLNLVTVPTWLVNRIGSSETPRFLKKHFYEATPIFLWDEISSELTLNGKPTDFKYTPLKGLFRVSHPESTPSENHKTNDIYLSDYESIDLFDKSKFDW